MGKVIIAAALVLGLSGTAWAQKKDCGELKADKQADGKVVGTCDGGAKKIVYKRG
jgi:hypothetical protein